MEIIENIFYVAVIIFSVVVSIMAVGVMLETPAREERIRNKRFAATIKRFKDEEMQKSLKESELISN